MQGNTLASPGGSSCSSKSSCEPSGVGKGLTACACCVACLYNLSLLSSRPNIMYKGFSNRKVPICVAFDKGLSLLAFYTVSRVLTKDPALLI